MSRLRRLSFILGSSLFALLGLGVSQLTAPNASAQAGTSTGSIQGTVLDPNGGSIAQAKVSITSKGTGARTAPQVTGTGAYNSGPLVPGEYLIRVEATAQALRRP
jgi:hypothetical protein